MKQPSSCRLCHQWQYRGLRHGIGVGLCRKDGAEKPCNQTVCDADPNASLLNAPDISKFFPNDATNMLTDASEKEVKELFDAEIAALLHVYGYTGHPGRAGDMCSVPKKLLMEAARRIYNGKICSEQECQLPCSEKEECEFYQHGFCNAKDPNFNRPLTLDDLKSMRGKYVYWDNPTKSSMCRIEPGYGITPDGYTFSLEHMLNYGRIYCCKPAGLTDTQPDSDEERYSRQDPED